MTGQQDDGGDGTGSRAVVPDRPQSAQLYERDLEIAAAEQAVDELCARVASESAGPGGLLLHSGAAGLGKTALLTRARRFATARGCTVLFARGSELERTLPFRVVRQLLQPQLAALAEAERRELFGGWYDVAGPAVGLLPPGESVLDPQGVRDGLDLVVTRLAARRSPLVLVVDDAHWADSESLAWLASFAARVRELPILAVLAYRPEELPEEATAFRSFIEGESTHTLRLQELSPAAVADLVHAALGEQAEDGFCRECWAVTGGNQYETVELLAKVRDRGLAPAEDSAPLLRDLGAAARGSGLVAQLDRLGRSTVRFAWAAAVLGTEIPQELAASVAGIDSATAAEAVDLLREARLLTRTDPLEFVHPLIATAVYRAIPAAARTAMHGQAAWALMDAGLGMAAASRHLLETHPDGDWETVEQLRAAAREHLAVGAPDAARRCLERALAEPPPAELRAPVLYELGCSALLTSPATTVNHLRAALALPGIDAVLHQDATVRLAQALGHLDRLGDAAETLRHEADRARDPLTHRRLLTASFMWSAFRAEEPHGLLRVRRLARLADGLTGADRGERDLLALRAWDAVVGGESAVDGVDLSDRALGPGIDWIQVDHFEIPMLIALCYVYLDRLHRAEALFSASIAAYQKAGWSGAHLSFAHTLLGLTCFRHGRLVEAERLAREGLRLSDRIGPRTPAHWYAVSLLIETLLARGKTDEALALADEYAFGPPFPNALTFPDPQYVYGTLLLAQGLRDEAAKELAAVGERMEPRGRHNPGWCPWAGHLAVALAYDDPVQARALADRTLQRAERFGTGSAVGTALRFAAAVADPQEAPRLLAQAVSRLSQSPCAHEYALALVDHGAALCRVGRPEDAADKLVQGVALAEQCGADGLADRGRAELAAADLQVPE